jgi:hypothetical protein
MALTAPRPAVARLTALASSDSHRHLSRCVCRSVVAASILVAPPNLAPERADGAHLAMAPAASYLDAGQIHPPAHA